MRTAAKPSKRIVLSCNLKLKQQKIFSLHGAYRALRLNPSCSFILLCLALHPLSESSAQSLKKIGGTMKGPWGLALKWGTPRVPLGLDVSVPIFREFSRLSCEDFPSSDILVSADKEYE